jgi:hypothetical protein
VIAPDRDEQWSTDQQSGRCAIACAGCFGGVFYKRSILGTIALGMAIYLPLHIGLGW